MIPLPSTVTAIAFDLDETLYDRDLALRRLLRAWLPGLTAADEAGIVSRDARGYSPRVEYFTWMAAAWPALAADGAALWDRFRRELPRYIEPDPAAASLLLTAIGAGWGTGILTNGSADYQLAKLDATGLATFFPAGRVLVSGALGTAKPDARAFAALAAALEQPPARILYVGDHEENDIRGAHRAGLRTCWLRRRDPGKSCEAADLIIDSLAELRPLLFPA